MAEFVVGQTIWIAYPAFGSISKRQFVSASAEQVCCADEHGLVCFHPTANVFHTQQEARDGAFKKEK